MKRRIVLAVAAFALATVTSTALAATPKGGARFSGTASGKVTFATTFPVSDPLTFTVSSKGTTLQGLTYSDNACGLATTKVVKVGTVKLGTGGSFSASSVASAPLPDATKDGKKVVTTTSIKGSFVSATKVTGTLDYTQTEPGTPTRCGPIKLKFTATG